jgi:hypothetical protein
MLYWYNPGLYVIAMKDSGYDQLQFYHRKKSNELRLFSHCSNYRITLRER